MLRVSGRKARFGLAGVACLVTVLAAGCGGSGGQQTSGGGRLVIDSSFVVQSLDPHRDITPTQLIANKGIYQTLLTSPGSSTKPGPGLATAFTASSDAKTYTFTLRKNVTFSDGTPMTSADVLFSFNRVINLKSGPASLIAGITASAPAKYTFVLHSAAPNPAIPAIVTSPALGIVNSKLVKQKGGTDAPGADKSDKADRFFNTASAGSGPYILKSYTTNNQIVLDANPKYWGAQKPHFSEVVIRNMQAPTQLLNVQRGANEIAVDLSAKQAATLKGNAKLTVSVTPSPSVFSLQANMDPKVSKVTSNPKIQEAIRYGLSYDGLKEIAGQGAIQAAGLIPSMFLGSLPASDEVHTDLARAKAAVAASGIKNPSATLAYPSDLSVNGVQFATLAQRVKADLAGIGISLQLQAIPVATFLPKYLAGKLELAQSYWFPDYPDPGDYVAFLPGGAVSKRLNWDKNADPAVERLGAQVVSTTDNAQRGQLWQTILKRLNQSSPFFPLIQTAQALVGSSNLTGLALNPTWILDPAAVGSR
jgi:peptide/nickel transport system substrate-binding protein